MKSVFKFLVGASFLVSLYSGVAFASTDMAPDVLVKQTADDVLTIIKNDKEIQACLTLILIVFAAWYLVKIGSPRHLNNKQVFRKSSVACCYVRTL